jgi:hypothetical protein
MGDAVLFGLVFIDAFTAIPLGYTGVLIELLKQPFALSIQKTRKRAVDASVKCQSVPSRGALNPQWPAS